MISKEDFLKKYITPDSNGKYTKNCECHFPGSSCDGCPFDEDSGILIGNCLEEIQLYIKQRKLDKIRELLK